MVIKLVKRGLIVSSEEDIDNLDIKNIDFVILRVGFTDYNLTKTKYKDISFDENYEWAKKNNLKVGALYESRATTMKQASDEIDYLISLIKYKVFEYPIIISIKDEHNTIIYYHENHKTISLNLLNDIVSYIYNMIKTYNYVPLILTKETFLNKEFNRNNYNILLDDETINNILYLDIHNLSSKNVKSKNETIFNKISIGFKILMSKVRKK